MIDLTGKRVVITGAAGGVGQVLVDRFAHLGAAVIACDLPGARFDGDMIEQAHLFDLTDRQATGAAAEAITASGVPDCVVSNAGWTRAETFAQLTPGRFDHEITLNFRGAADLASAFLPAMRQRAKPTSFVFISSVNAVSHFGNPAYSAAKAALNAFARAIAVEEGRNGIRANVVMPGSIRTAAWDHRAERDPQVFERVSALYPLGRMVTPEEVANAAAFLASDMASGITGTALPVDGGITSGCMPFVRELE